MKAHMSKFPARPRVTMNEIASLIKGFEVFKNHQDLTPEDVAAAFLESSRGDGIMIASWLNRNDKPVRLLSKDLEELDKVDLVYLEELDKKTAQWARESNVAKDLPLAVGDSVSFAWGWMGNYLEGQVIEILAEQALLKIKPSPKHQCYFSTFGPGATPVVKLEDVELL